MESCRESQQVILNTSSTGAAQVCAGEAVLVVVNVDPTELLLPFSLSFRAPDRIQKEAE